MKNILRLNASPDEGLSLSCCWHDNVCDLELKNTSRKEIRVGDITIFTAPMPFSADTAVFGEGYNKLAQYGGTISDTKLTVTIRIINFPSLMSSIRYIIWQCSALKESCLCLWDFHLVFVFPAASATIRSLCSLQSTAKTFPSCPVKA